MLNPDATPVGESPEARIGFLLQELDAYLEQVMLLYSTPNALSTASDSREKAWERIDGHSKQVSGLLNEIDKLL
jgi:hypothetical protein